MNLSGLHQQYGTQQWTQILSLQKWPPRTAVRSTPAFLTSFSSQSRPPLSMMPDSAKVALDLRTAGMLLVKMSANLSQYLSMKGWFRSRMFLMSLLPKLLATRLSSSWLTCLDFSLSFLQFRSARKCLQRAEQMLFNYVAIPSTIGEEVPSSRALMSPKASLDLAGSLQVFSIWSWWRRCWTRGWKKQVRTSASRCSSGFLQVVNETCFSYLPRQLKLWVLLERREAKRLMSLGNWPMWGSRSSSSGMSFLPSSTVSSTSVMILMRATQEKLLWRSSFLMGQLSGCSVSLWRPLTSSFFCLLSRWPNTTMKSLRPSSSPSRCTILSLRKSTHFCLSESTRVGKASLRMSLETRSPQQSFSMLLRAKLWRISCESRPLDSSWSRMPVNLPSTCLAFWDSGCLSRKFSSTMAPSGLFCSTPASSESLGNSNSLHTLAIVYSAQLDLINSFQLTMMLWKIWFFTSWLPHLNSRCTTRLPCFFTMNELKNGFTFSKFSRAAFPRSSFATRSIASIVGSCSPDSFFPPFPFTLCLYLLTDSLCTEFDPCLYPCLYPSFFTKFDPCLYPSFFTKFDPCLYPSFFTELDPCLYPSFFSELDPCLYPSFFTEFDPCLYSCLLPCLYSCLLPCLYSCLFPCLQSCFYSCLAIPFYFLCCCFMSDYYKLSTVTFIKFHDIITIIRIIFY